MAGKVSLAQTGLLARSFASSPCAQPALAMMRSSLRSSRIAPSSASSPQPLRNAFTARSFVTSLRSSAPRLSSSQNAATGKTARAASAGSGSSIWAFAQRRFASNGPGSFLSAPHAAPGMSVPTSISQPGGWNRLLINVGIVAGAAFAAQIFFNRPQRDTPLSQYARDYLNSTFQYLAGGLSLTALSAVGLHRAGFSVRLMQASPWLVLGVGLVASIGGMIGAQTLEPGSPGKYACWALFNLSQAAVLSPLLFFNPALLARAGLYTAGVVGSLCYVGATAKDDTFLWMGGPLLAGVTIVALSSLSPMILPARMLRTLAVTEAISMYGGLAVFSGFVLWDTQKILNHARMAERGMLRPDPLRESIGLELDFINIFVRMVMLLSNQQSRRK